MHELCRQSNMRHATRNHARYARVSWGVQEVGFGWLWKPAPVHPRAESQHLLWVRASCRAGVLTSHSLLLVAILVRQCCKSSCIETAVHMADVTQDHPHFFLDGMRHARNHHTHVLWGGLSLSSMAKLPSNSIPTLPYVLL